MDAKFSRSKVKSLLRKVHDYQKNTQKRAILDQLNEPMMEPKREIHQKIHSLKQPEENNNENAEAMQLLLSEISKRLETRDNRIDTIQQSLKDLKNTIDKISGYEEESRSIKLSAKEKQLKHIEEQLANFEHKLAMAAKNYRDESLYPLKQKIEELKEKHKALLEQKAKEEVVVEHEEEKDKAYAEELKRRISELELNEEIPSVEERKIAEEVEQLGQDINAQDVTLDLPDFMMPQEEELSLPSPIPEFSQRMGETSEEIKETEEEILPPPPLPKKRTSVVDNLFGGVRKLMSKS